MGLVTRKPVFAVSGEVRFKLACSATETSQKVEISLVASLDVLLSKKQKIKALNRLRGCAGWSVPLLFQTLRRQVLLRQGPYGIVCEIFNFNSFHFFYIQTCSYVGDVYLLFCAHLMNIFSFFGVVNLDNFPSRILRLCLVHITCNSNSCHSFILILYIMMFTYSRCITVLDSICVERTLSVQPRLYLCLCRTLSVKTTLTYHLIK